MWVKNDDHGQSRNEDEKKNGEGSSDDDLPLPDDLFHVSTMPDPFHVVHAHEADANALDGNYNAYQDDEYPKPIWKGLLSRYNVFLFDKPILERNKKME